MGICEAIRREIWDKTRNLNHIVHILDFTQEDIFSPGKLQLEKRDLVQVVTTYYKTSPPKAITRIYNKWATEQEFGEDKNLCPLFPVFEHQSSEEAEQEHERIIKQVVNKHENGSYI